MIVLDTETTGLPLVNAALLTDQPRVIELAAIKLSNDRLEEQDRLHFFCNPGVRLLPKITKLTGITDQELAGHKPFSAFVMKLSYFFLGEEYLVSHNLVFDRSILIYELRRLDRLNLFHWPIHHLCTVERTMELKGHRLKLSDLYELATDRKLTEAHRAINDAESLVECIRWLRGKDLI